MRVLGIEGFGLVMLMGWLGGGGRGSGGGWEMTGLVAGRRSVRGTSDGVDWISAVARGRRHHGRRRRRRRTKVFVVVVVLIGAEAAVLGRGEEGGTRGSQAAHPIVLGAGGRGGGGGAFAHTAGRRQHRRAR